IPTLEVFLYVPLIEAALGENATLSCNVTEYDSGLFYWYKINHEYMIQTVAQGYFKKVKLEAQFKILRFDIQTVGNVYLLIIKNIQKEDEGTYLCQAGEAYRMAFINGTKLGVKQNDVQTSQETTLLGNRTTAATIVFQTIRVSHQITQIGASLGDTVTLICNVTGHRNLSIYWYKVNYGDIIQTVASRGLYRVTLEAEFSSPRYSIMKAGHVYCLTIRNVRKEDEATYVCQAIAANKLAFINGTHLAVNDHKNRMFVNVKQISETMSVLVGTEITLECSFTLLEINKERDRCAAEHSVFWFKAGSQADPGTMYAARNICDTEAGRSCSYRLSKTIQNPSDTGIYHCAVVTCGEILFGGGTKVELGSKKKMGSSCHWTRSVVGSLCDRHCLPNFLKKLNV
ncbi:hypothetical protein CCH79_00005759, partial [Gambusia affinis]